MDRLSFLISELRESIGTAAPVVEHDCGCGCGGNAEDCAEQVDRDQDEKDEVEAKEDDREDDDKDESIEAGLTTLAIEDLLALERMFSSDLDEKMAKLGSGARFKELEKHAAASGAKNPAAIAAWAGDKKWGKSRMAKMAAAGKKK